jgi:hypothetical protein
MLLGIKYFGRYKDPENGKMWVMPAVVKRPLTITAVADHPKLTKPGKSPG